MATIMDSPPPRPASSTPEAHSSIAQKDRGGRRGRARRRPWGKAWGRQQAWHQAGLEGHLEHRLHATHLASPIDERGLSTKATRRRIGQWHQAGLEAGIAHPLEIPSMVGNMVTLCHGFMPAFMPSTMPAGCIGALRNGIKDRGERGSIWTSCLLRHLEAGELPHGVHLGL